MAITRANAKTKADYREWIVRWPSDVYSFHFALYQGE